MCKIGQNFVLSLPCLSHPYCAEVMTRHQMSAQLVKLEAEHQGDGLLDLNGEYVADQLSHIHHEQGDL